MENNNFVHLHVHSQFSLLDGACEIKRLIKKVKELGQTAVAITDHGVMNGVVDHYKTAIKEGIKPIIGCECYVAPRKMSDKVFKIDNHPHHLVLLCKDNIGYQNLIKLCSIGHIDGFYGKPRIDKDLLKNHTQGLIALSACLAGEIPRALLNDDYTKAKEIALFYNEIFGQDNFFIEIQNHQINEQIKILPSLIRLSIETGIPLVATNDAHYIDKADHQSQHILMCIQTNKTIYEKGGLEFSTNEFYIKSKDEMLDAFKNFEKNEILKAIENTEKIANRCNVSFEFDHLILPTFIAPNNQNNMDFFLSVCNEGLNKLYGENCDEKIKQRFDFEISIIKKMGYIDFYLITYDFINYAKKNKIAVGPGRGSGAGSIIAYCMGITGIDPIKYNLLFERFLNPERITMPDFDIDFCYENRQRVIDYVNNKYGIDRVCQIITFGTMAARAVIRDVGRVMGLPYSLCDKISKMIPREINITIEKALFLNHDLKNEYEQDEKVKQLIDYSKSLEGMPRHASTHAAGVVVTPKPVVEFVPLQKNDEAIVTQFTKETVEELGLLKIDFLGLRTLTAIDKTVNQILKTHLDFDIEKIPYDDINIYNMLSKGDSNCVFQFESAGMKRVLTLLKPETIEDLIAVISLYRPGPMDSIPKYIKNKHSKQQITYKHPLLKPILEVTYGCVVYQEQVMEICRNLAGFSYGRADLVRRAMAKKKLYIMENERNNFIYGLNDEKGNTIVRGCVNNGIDEKIANEIFDEMSNFASYAFNKSHAAGYAVLAYQTAYLKFYYPSYFLSAMLTTYLEDTNKVAFYIQECKKLNINVLPPDVNKSFEGFIAEGDTIRFGLLAIKNIGKGFIYELIKERELNGDFFDLYDFCNRMYDKEINKRAVESMIKSGAFACFNNNRRQMSAVYETILQSLNNTARSNIKGQINMFDDPSLTENVKTPIPPLKEFSDKEICAMEKDVIGLYLSGHPMDEFENLIKEIGSVTLNHLTKETEYKDGDELIITAIVASKQIKPTKQGDSMAFINLEDWFGTIEMIVFAKTYSKCQLILQTDNIVVVKGRLSFKDDEEPKLICVDVILPNSPIVYDFCGKKKSFEAVKEKKVYLKLKNSDYFNDVIKIIGEENNNNNKDYLPIVLFYENEKKYWSAPSKYKIKKDDTEIIFKLKHFFGEENVVVK